MNALEHFKQILFSYHPLSNECWSELVKITSEKKYAKNTILIDFDEVPASFYFIHQGLVRVYTISDSEAAKEVNKNFFDEGRFPASVVASLERAPSRLCLETLEDSSLLEINYLSFRELLDRFHDLKWFHIKYLEKHWVKEKEPVEISLLDGEAKRRYLDFLGNYPKLAERIPLFHLASRLGITPTQLSRIRKTLNR